MDDDTVEIVPLSGFVAPAVAPSVRRSVIATGDGRHENTKPRSREGQRTKSRGPFCINGILKFKHPMVSVTSRSGSSEGGHSHHRIPVRPFETERLSVEAIKEGHENRVPQWLPI